MLANIPVGPRIEKGWLLPWQQLNYRVSNNSAIMLAKIVPSLILYPCVVC